MRDQTELETLRAIGTFRCGYCGQPTNDTGIPLTVIPDAFGSFESQLTHGKCCVYQECFEVYSRTIAREMALDAGMPETEGSRY